MRLAMVYGRATEEENLRQNQNKFDVRRREKFRNNFWLAAYRFKHDEGRFLPLIFSFGLLK